MTRIYREAYMMILLIALLAAPFLLMALYEYLDRERLGIRPAGDRPARPQLLLAGIICGVVVASVASPESCP